jgi:hypothetical protein
MIQFKTFIAENLEKYTKLKHLEHAEDLPIDSGEHGYQHAIEAMKNVHKKLQGKFNETRITTKFDGSPSVVFGHNPENGKFFVASKSAFNATPKLNYTPEDVERNHGHAPGLVGKLKHALEHLPKVAPKQGVYQGDMMYSGDDVHTHGGEHNFTPNTIQYSTPENSEEGKKISKAKMGIVVHTKYHGRTLGNMSAGFEPDLHKFKQHKDVHIIPHEVGSDVLHTGANQKEFERHMAAAESEHAKAHPDTFDSIHPHATHIKTYINQTVRHGTKPSLEGYRKHLMNDGEKEVASVKQAKTKQAKHEAMMGKLHHVEQHAKQFDSMFKMHHHLQKAKDALVDTLSHSSPYEHTIGGKETKPEGFVAIHKGHPIKLVDRAEFSRANFNKVRD